MDSLGDWLKNSYIFLEHKKLATGCPCPVMRLNLAMQWDSSFLVIIFPYYNAIIHKTERGESSWAEILLTQFSQM